MRLEDLSIMAHGLMRPQRLFGDLLAFSPICSALPIIRAPLADACIWNEMTVDLELISSRSNWSFSSSSSS